tara:strand:- start:432 stop:905 length:474 start_codon:yes stop_codon:yes gene_type:complete
MFAVVEINDKQHLVHEGKILTIDGSIDEKKTTFSNILLVQDDKKTVIGQPYVKNAAIEVSIIEVGKREKDIVFKFKRKTGYKLTRGHRQNSTLIKIEKITFSDTIKAEPKSVKTKTEEKKTQAKKTEKSEAKAAPKKTKESAKKQTKKASESKTKET